VTLVLVVDDSPTQAYHMAAVLRAAGHEVTTAGNGIEALAAIRRAVPDVVVSDIHMPEMDGLALVAAVRSDFPGVPVLVATSQGSEELAVAALRGGAAGYVPKRNLDSDLVPAVDDILSVAAAQRKQSLFLDRMSAAEYHFELENDPDLVPLVVGHVETVLRTMNLFDPSDHMRVGLAVHEAVVNAIVHGNLEVSSDLKQGDWSAYHQAIADRAEQSPYRDRRVNVTVRATRTPYLSVRVRDEGPGFDPSKLPDPTDPAHLDLTSGRGLLLIRTFFDRVAHSPRGNEITMVKGKSGPEGT
jgi:CheY-like chemotaxis protein/anti-sigma regulatory factor (Ser/Thr protein kinase)